MSVKNNVPEIRFKGFCGNWKNKAIGSILTETKRPVELLDNELYQLVTVRRRNEGVVPRATLKGKDILVKNYYGVKAGDYLISKRQVVHGANGIVPDSLDNAVVSNEYLVVTDSDEVTAKFLTVISKRPEMHKLFFISSYGVDIEKLVFDVSDWKNRSITIPDVTEQNSITDYFQKLDNLINQHKQKHDKLNSIKKAMLEKMFPKQGETIPEIRFKGFSGDWKERSWRDTVDISTNMVDPRCSQYGGLFHVGPGNIESFTGMFYNNVLKVKDSNLISGKFHFNKGDIIYGKINPQLAKYVIAPFEGLASADAYVLNTKNGVVQNYLYVILQTEDFYKYTVSVSSRTGMPKINRDELNIYTYLSPDEAEQHKIGKYFQKLDTLINQHQQQITKLTNIKQACLSNMFV